MALIRIRASTGSNQATRSISGNAVVRPERGGHSISKVLERAAAGSTSPSIAQAWTTLPPFWTIDAELQQGTVRDRVPGLLGELAPRDGEQRLVAVRLALRDRPGPGVTLREIRTARVRQQCFQSPRGPAVEHDPGTDAGPHRAMVRRTLRCTPNPREGSRFGRVRAVTGRSLIPSVQREGNRCERSRCSRLPWQPP